MTVLEEQFLDKRVTIKVPARDDFGNLTNRLTEVSGVCKFIGKNELIGWELQVTINRTPFEVKHITHITLNE